jgi:hypothetical protein
MAVRLGVGGPDVRSVLPGSAQAAWFAPDPQLAGDVAGYWTLVVRRPPGMVWVIPDGLVDITFRLDGPGTAWVTGPPTTPALNTHTGAIELLGVGLRPGAARRVLRTSAAALNASGSPSNH